MSLEIPQEGFEFWKAGTSLPSEFRNGVCKTMMVELLKTPHSENRDETAKNHAILKIDFEEQVLRYDGVRISMTIDEKNESSQEEGEDAKHLQGKLCIKPVRYTGPSDSAECTNTVTLKRTDISLGDLLQVFLEFNFDIFYFVNIKDKYYGCRDYIAQVLARFVQKEYIELLIDVSIPGNIVPELSLPVPVVFEILGMWFGPDRIVWRPIDKGLFLPDCYDRISEEDILYKRD